MTWEVVDAPDLRVIIDPSDERIVGAIPGDVRHGSTRADWGDHQHLDIDDIGHLNIALAFVMGLAD